MRIRYFLALACAALALPAGTVAHAADLQTEQAIGAIDVIVFVCTPIDPKSGKAAAEMLAARVAQGKLDLAAIRKSDGYQSIYGPELNRMLAMTKPDRIRACQTAL